MSDTPDRHSRRAVIAAGLGALAASAVGAFERPGAALAADPNDLVLGAANVAQAPTSLKNGSGGDALSVISVSGYGLIGRSSTGTAVLGDCGSGIGGGDGSGTGVEGVSQSGPGVSGMSLSGNGVTGLSSGANGVYGTTSIGGSGVYGSHVGKGSGVRGRTAHGVGVLAEASASDGVALKATGVTQFQRSGRLTIAAGRSSVSKSAIRVDSGTLVLAVLQDYRSGVYVAAATPNASGNSFTIRLNKAVTSATRVAWFLVN